MALQIKLKINPTPRACEAVHDRSLSRCDAFYFICKLIRFNLSSGSTLAQALNANTRDQFS